MSSRQLVFKVVDGDVVEDAGHDPALNLGNDVLVFLTEAKSDDEKVVLSCCASLFKGVAKSLIVESQRLVRCNNSLFYLAISYNKYGPSIWRIVIVRFFEGFVSQVAMQVHYFELPVTELVDAALSRPEIRCRAGSRILFPIDDVVEDSIEIDREIVDGVVGRLNMIDRWGEVINYLKHLAK